MSDGAPALICPCWEGGTGLTRVDSEHAPSRTAAVVSDAQLICVSQTLGCSFALAASRCLNLCARRVFALPLLQIRSSPRRIARHSCYELQLHV